MKNAVKELTLMEMNCPEDDFTALEKIHYEVLTTEKILGIALSNSLTRVDGAFNDYYKNYMQLYKEYEREKDNFYHKYIVNHIDENIHHVWEANFFSKTILLYE